MSLLGWSLDQRSKVFEIKEEEIFLVTGRTVTRWAEIESRMGGAGGKFVHTELDVLTEKSPSKIQKSEMKMQN